jgi:hypothetical protein
MDGEVLDLTRFDDVGIVKNTGGFESSKLTHFSKSIARMKSEGEWNKVDLVQLFKELIPEFTHEEKGKSLDNKM